MRIKEGPRDAFVVVRFAPKIRAVSGDLSARLLQLLRNLKAPSAALNLNAHLKTTLNNTYLYAGF